MKIESTDLNFMDTEHVIASFLLLGDDSAALVETGPTTCLESLMGGLKDRGVYPEDVRQVFLTHIQLDHSGASGHLSGLLPNATFYVRPPTPPPEIDLESWVQSIGFMRQLSPGSLWPTHFGRFDDVERHLSELEQRLQDWVLFVEELMNGGTGRDEIAAELETKGDAEMLAEGAQPEDADGWPHEVRLKAAQGNPGRVTGASSNAARRAPPGPGSARA